MILDKYIIKKVKKGDKEALLNLIMKKEDEFYALSYSYMKNENDAMDALQEMIVKIYLNIEKLKDVNKFYSWSKTILVNICKDKLKENKKIITIDSSEEISYEVDMDEELYIDQILGNLDIKHREIIELKYILNYTYEEISELLNIPIGTVKSRSFNGLEKIKNKIDRGILNVR